MKPSTTKSTKNRLGKYLEFYDIDRVALGKLVKIPTHRLRMLCTVSYHTIRATEVYKICSAIDRPSGELLEYLFQDKVKELTPHIHFN